MRRDYAMVGVSDVLKYQKVLNEKSGGKLILKILFIYTVLLTINYLHQCTDAQPWNDASNSGATAAAAATRALDRIRRRRAAS